MKRAGCLAFLVILLGTGCLSEPLNRQEVPAAAIKFVGLVDDPSQRVHIECLTSTAGWDSELGSRSPDSTPHTDAIGTTFYKWEDVQLIDKRCWTAVQGEPKKIQAQIKLWQIYRDDGSKGYLHIFENNNDENDRCLKNYGSLGIEEVIRNCKSNDSPTLTVYADCGGHFQNCCVPQTCDEGFSCGIANVCITPDDTLVSNYCNPQAAITCPQGSEWSSFSCTCLNN